MDSSLFIKTVCSAAVLFALGAVELCAAAPFAVRALPPVNDLCINRLSAQLGLNSFDNRDAGGEGGNACGSGRSSVFFSFVSPVSGPLNISLCGLTALDSVIGIFASCGSTTPIVCNDDGCGLQSTLLFDAQANVPVVIRVHGYDGAQGFGEFRIGPMNDECAGAQVIADGANMETINGATPSGVDIGCLTPFADVWFVYTATCTGGITIDTCGTGTTFDTVLSAYRGVGCPVDSSRQVGCNDDACGAQSRLIFPATAGESYLIRLSNFDPIPAGVANVMVRCSLLCACNVNRDGFLNSQDFFDFVSCFFGGGCPVGQTADYNLDGVSNSQDFFDFLVCFFGGLGC